MLGRVPSVALSSAAVAVAEAVTVVVAVADADGNAGHVDAIVVGVISGTTAASASLLNDAGSILWCCARACSSGVRHKVVSSTVCCISIRSLLWRPSSLLVTVSLSLKVVFVLGVIGVVKVSSTAPSWCSWMVTPVSLASL